MPDWVLAGIVNATFIYGNQPRVYAVYGNATSFADLSYYNKAYKTALRCHEDVRQLFDYWRRES